MRRKQRDEQWEDIVDTWYNNSEWGRRRKQRIAAFWIGAALVAAVAVVIVLLAS